MTVWHSFFCDQTGCPLAGLRRAQSNRGRIFMKLYERTNVE